MTIQSEINRIKTGIQNVYTVMEAKHATIPATKNLNNLVTTGETLPDFTLMGNQLRKACAYTNTQDVSGQYKFYFESGATSEIFTATNFSSYYHYCAFDGKYYVLNNSGVLEDRTPDNKVAVKVYKENVFFEDSLYYNNGSLIKIADLSYNNTLKALGNICYVYNGKLYRNNTLINEDYYWSDVSKDAYKLYFIGDNTFFYCDTVYNLDSTTQFVAISSDVSVDYLVCSSAVSGDKTLITCSGNIINLPSSIKKISDSLLLLENGDLYEYNGAKIASNVISLSGYYYMLENKEIYNYRNKLNIDIEDDIELVGIGAQSMSNNGFFARYKEGSIVDTTIFTTTVDKTKAYLTTKNINYITTTVKDDNTIVNNEKEYIRNNIMDSTFTFVPSDLRSHQFTDQELCQAYLNAGAIASS